MSLEPWHHGLWKALLFYIAQKRKIIACYMMPLTELCSDFSDVTVKVKIMCLRKHDLFCIPQSPHSCSPAPACRWRWLHSTGLALPIAAKLLTWAGRALSEGRVLCSSFSHTHCFAPSRHSRHTSWLNKYVTKASEEIYQQKKVKITKGPKNGGSPSFIGE